MRTHVVLIDPEDEDFQLTGLSFPLDRTSLAIIEAPVHIKQSNKVIQKLVHKTLRGVPHVGCAAPALIYGTDIVTDKILLMLIQFQHPTSEVQILSAKVKSLTYSFNFARGLTQKIEKDPVGIFCLADATVSAGGHIAQACSFSLSETVPVVGGTTGSMDKDSWQICNGVIDTGLLIFVCFYGEKLQLNFGTGSGWERSGGVYTITKCLHNLLIEIDHQPALDIFKKVINPKDLSKIPSSLIKYPFCTFPKLRNGSYVVAKKNIRGGYALDVSTNAVVLSGEINSAGNFMQFLKSTPADMVDGAKRAVKDVSELLLDKAGVVFVTSCYGRYATMGPQAQEELKASLPSLQALNFPVVGFYAWGEFCPSSPNVVTDYLAYSFTLWILQEDC